MRVLSRVTFAGTVLGVGRMHAISELLLTTSAQFPGSTAPPLTHSDANTQGHWNDLTAGPQSWSDSSQNVTHIPCRDHMAAYTDLLTFILFTKQSSAKVPPAVMQYSVIT